MFRKKGVFPFVLSERRQFDCSLLLAKLSIYYCFDRHARYNHSSPGFCKHQTDESNTLKIWFHVT